MMSWNEIAGGPGEPAAHLWIQEGQAPIVLLDGQVLFFNHGAALSPSIAIIPNARALLSEWPSVTAFEYVRWFSV